MERVAVPPTAVTVTLTVPAARAGAVTITDVAVTEMMGAGVDPNMTLEVVPSRDPVSVTL